MKKIILILIFLHCIDLYASEQRALFIAIDTYLPENPLGKAVGRSWVNLDGCVNDAMEMKEIAKAKFGFSNEKNIQFIQNQECTRNRIIEELNKLILNSKKGDIVFIYYAGHGSQTKNSLSAESDFKDETIVPADAYLGVKDIRDKELAALFNKLLDKGVVLTVIFDSCHSGSIGRGPLSNKTNKLRYIPGSDLDAKDATIITNPPETRGALILSAAQDDECASEMEDDQGRPHGAFTASLLKALQSLPANSSTEQIFNSTRAILKYNNKKQEPIIAGNIDRKNGTLFGVDPALLNNNKTIIAVINANDPNSIKLQGGYALGISKNCEFRLVSDTTISVEVTTIDGVNKCSAKLKSGDGKKIKAGEFFELSLWASSPITLKVFMPSTKSQNAELTKEVNAFANALVQNGYTIINDPTLVSATNNIFYSQDANWYLGMPDGAIKSIGKKLDATKISLAKDAKIYIAVPANEKAVDYFTNQFKTNNSVEIVNNADNANYILSGRLQNGNLEYALIAPNLNNKDDAYTSTLPTRTNFVILDNANKGADSIMNYALRLSKIKAWLSLQSSADGSDGFPFSLAIKQKKDNSTLTQGELHNGDKIGFVLVKDKRAFASASLQRRYVYVFAIDNTGKTQLVFPLESSGSVENRLPISAMDVPDEIQLGAKAVLEISEPFGNDTYIMITTDEPLPNPSSLEGDAVKTRGVASDNWLNQLGEVGAKTRSKIITPTTWSLQRITVKTKE